MVYGCFKAFKPFQGLMKIYLKLHHYLNLHQLFQIIVTTFFYDRLVFSGNFYNFFTILKRAVALHVPTRFASL